MPKPFDTDCLLIGEGQAVILDCHLDHWSDFVCGDKNGCLAHLAGVAEQIRNIGDISSSSKARRQMFLVLLPVRLMYGVV
jgi:hypothetical protein